MHRRMKNDEGQGENKKSRTAFRRRETGKRRGELEREKERERERKQRKEKSFAATTDHSC
jgi:hypothetical protein